LFNAKNFCYALNSSLKEFSNQLLDSKAFLASSRLRASGNNLYIFFSNFVELLRCLGSISINQFPTLRQKLIS